MTDGREELLNRLTLAGWLTLVANMAVFTVAAPLILVNVWPAVLQGGGRAAGYAMLGTFMLFGGASFLTCKWILEKCGITVLRPAPPPCDSHRCR